MFILYGSRGSARRQEEKNKTKKRQENALLLSCIYVGRVLRLQSSIQNHFRYLIHQGSRVEGSGGFPMKGFHLVYLRVDRLFSCLRTVVWLGFVYVLLLHRPIAFLQYHSFLG